ncbi:hypothetical protein GBF38_010342 [Nibea albiflora]|uniref:Uncharacterized protein n=1 Tax=Nibea albiflora TaxID=240163 RepID=A0ACB7F2P2_NIBAL|nr:hypothetical protein GBF38_010342 [Nibea albiflora]
MLRCGARRQSGKHRLNLGSTAPRAFVIWSRSSRQVAAVVDCSPCTLSRYNVRRGAICEAYRQIKYGCHIHDDTRGLLESRCESGSGVTILADLPHLS